MPPAGEQRIDLLDPPHGVFRLEGHPPQEVGQPLLPCSPLRQSKEMGVVSLARGLEVGAQVEERRGQHAARHQQERDQEASDAAIAVEEGVDRLEVGVGDGGVHERRQGLVVEEPLPGGEARHQLIGRGRDVGRVVHRAARRSDPVLAAPELARRRHVPAHPPHEVLVQLAHEPQRNGQRRQPL